MNFIKNMISLLVTTIAMMTTTSSVGATTPSTNVTTSASIKWIMIDTYAFPPVTTLATGDQLTFDWNGTFHNVYQFPNKTAYNDCDFTNATKIGTTGPVTINVTEGLTYYGCSVGVHCSTHGQKVVVIV